MNVLIRIEKKIYECLKRVNIYIRLKQSELRIMMISRYYKDRTMSKEQQKKWPNEPMSLTMKDGTHYRLERDANGDMSDFGKALLAQQQREKRESTSKTSN